MHTCKRLLLALDTSEASDCVLSYVGIMTSGRRDLELVLLHVPRPMPSELLEFGGADDPVEESRAEAALHAAQSEWTQQEKEAAEPIFVHAQALLRQAGRHKSGLHRVAIQEAGESLESVILEAAREEGCGTVIVGYAAFPWLTDLVRQHLAEALLRKAEGLAIWVVR